MKKENLSLNVILWNKLGHSFLIWEYFNDKKKFKNSKEPGSWEPLFEDCGHDLTWYNQKIAVLLYQECLV